MHGRQGQTGNDAYLAKTPVASMQASLAKGPAIAPGEKLALVVQFTQPDGKVLMTEGKGKGKVLWSDMTVTPLVVTADQKGHVTLPRDLRVSDGKVGHVTITVPSHPDLRAELDIPIFPSPTTTTSSQICPAAKAATDWTARAAAWVPSIRIIRPRAETAQTEPMARMAKMEEMEETRRQCKSVSRCDLARTLSFKLVYRQQENSGCTWWTSKGGALTVKADGDPGGSGGRVGRGGRGGVGGIATPNGNSGSDGASGRNGFDGSQGRGGSITVT